MTKAAAMPNTGRQDEAAPQTARFIGDVHGKFGRYRELIRGVERSIQVGDMGVGFRTWPHGDPYANPPYDAMRQGEHLFIRGNHDNPAVCRRHSQWLMDGTFLPGNVMCIGGAVSVDKEYRHEGFDWWEDEELSYASLDAMVRSYELSKPRVMVTHETPEEIADLLMAASGRRKLDIPSRSRQAFQVMFEMHQPDLWIHGHWHVSWRKVVNGTQFICLNELEHIDLDLRLAEDPLPETKGIAAA